MVCGDRSRVAKQPPYVPAAGLVDLHLFFDPRFHEPGRLLLGWEQLFLERRDKPCAQTPHAGRAGCALSCDVMKTFRLDPIAGDQVSAVAEEVDKLDLLFLDLEPLSKLLRVRPATIRAGPLAFAQPLGGEPLLGRGGGAPSGGCRRTRHGSQGDRELHSPDASWVRGEETAR